MEVDTARNTVTEAWRENTAIVIIVIVSMGLVKRDTEIVDIIDRNIFDCFNSNLQYNKSKDDILH